MPRWLPICPADWQHCCHRDWHSLPTWPSTSWSRAGAKCADGQRTSYARAGEGRLTFKTLKSKAGEHSQWEAQFPHIRGLGLLVGSSTHSARQGGQQAELHSQGAPRLWPALCTNQPYKAQGETTLEHHFAFLKLPTLEVTCVSFCLCFPSYTAQAPSISPVFPRQKPGLGQCCEEAGKDSR